MARSLKTLGIEELNKLRRRVSRQHSLGRIYASDRDYINSRLQEVEARIVLMHEEDDEYKKEV